MWDEGKYAELAEDVVRDASTSLGKAPMPDDDDSIARRYHLLVIDGRLKAAVWYATNRREGGVLAPGDINAKTGLTVIEVLRNKHPKMRRPERERESWASFKAYTVPRQGVPIDCNQSLVEVVGGGMGGGAGPNSVDRIAFRHYLLSYKVHSLHLREELALWVEFLGNNIVPYAAHRTLETGRLSALDKQPGVRPIRVASAASRLLTRCELKVVGDDAIRIVTFD